MTRLVGDGERARAADALRRHYLLGRLTVDELDARLQAGLAARTRAELAHALRDLPPGWHDGDRLRAAAETTTAVARHVVLLVVKALVWLFASIALLVAYAAWLLTHGAELAGLVAFPLVWLALTWVLWFRGRGRRARQRF